MMTSTVAFGRIEVAKAYERLAPYIRRTPVLALEGSDIGLPGARITLKLEGLQCTGSFKPRGAFTNLLTRAIPETGVVAASGGNHGAAVAYAAKRLGVPAKIFVPAQSSAPKVAKIRAYGADLVICERNIDEAFANAQAYSIDTGALVVHPFDQYETMLGQATVAHELHEQAPDVTTVLVPIGGGGLLAGIAEWYAGEVAMIGVEPTGAPTYTRAMQAGKPVDAPMGSLANDSLAPNRIGDLVYPVLQRRVEQTLLVEDDDIRNAQRTLWLHTGIVAEPGGATAFAALLSGKYTPRPGEHVAIIVSGSNSTAVDFT